ncbi:phosphoribosyltransferase [Streptomyces griseomycini]|uniref:Phosphoribosyltransferase n=1 Tax=Streptomyces griseomycini TaxID=66895 RepID=A0A7W7PUE2_9ACTN|nr:phosphoribosyltransferase family protein [Streptomyces griseomycini]MBB4901488.1 putative phosphoribosyltransferase [Streptomyces griseomycini]GGQ15053.1 phosphoribosyltransferase [Streptomyces griseomycini]GGR25131.1 phosphoribosyltransferase [Streptomyces griseomycini]
MRYRDRRHAGEELALRLMEWAADGDLVDPLVLALPRGGVPVAAQVAGALRAPLDVLVARKIGVPGRPETGIGAIVGDDPPLYDRRALEMLGLSEDRLGSDVARERTELHRREGRYRGHRPPPRVADRAVILVDDGLATGVTARAALRHLRRRGPARLVLAVPVGAPGTADLMRAEADDLICLHQPPDFRAVGRWYEEFDQVDDEEVVRILNELSPTA